MQVNDTNKSFRFENNIQPKNENETEALARLNSIDFENILPYSKGLDVRVIFKEFEPEGDERLNVSYDIVLNGDSKSALGGYLNIDGRLYDNGAFEAVGEDNAIEDMIEAINEKIRPALNQELDVYYGCESDIVSLEAGQDFDKTEFDGAENYFAVTKANLNMDGFRIKENLYTSSNVVDYMSVKLDDGYDYLSDLITELEYSNYNEAEIEGRFFENIIKQLKDEDIYERINRTLNDNGLDKNYAVIGNDSTKEVFVVSNVVDMNNNGYNPIVLMGAREKNNKEVLDILNKIDGVKVGLYQEAYEMTVREINKELNSIHQEMLETSNAKRRM